jgi:hypothetical protein
MQGGPAGSEAVEGGCERQVLERMQLALEPAGMSLVEGVAAQPAAGRGEFLAAEMDGAGRG